MIIAELRRIEPPKGCTYCYTRWGGVIHLTEDFQTTRCNYPIEIMLTPDQAYDSAKSLCHGCFGK